MPKRTKTAPHPKKAQPAAALTLKPDEERKLNNYILAVIDLAPEMLSISSITRLIYELERRQDTRAYSHHLRSWRYTIQAINTSNPHSWPMTVKLPTGQIMKAKNRSEALESITDLLKA
jgi:hypothetical protein